MIDSFAYVENTTIKLSDIFSCIISFSEIKYDGFKLLVAMLQSRGYVGRGLREGIMDNVR